MTASVLLGCTMDVFIKTLGANYPLQQIVFARCFFALIPMSLIAYQFRGQAYFRTRRIDLHVWRSLFGISAMFCMFYGVSRLPLAEVTTLFYSAPLIAAALSVPFLGEKVGLRRWSAISLGFIGMLFVMSPEGGGAIHKGYLIVFAGTIIMSFSMIVIRIMGHSEKPFITTFYFTISSTIVSLLACIILGWQTPDAGDIWKFVAMGLCGGVAQFMLSNSFKFAEVGVVMPIRYLAIPVNVALGYFIWQEIPGISAQIGIFIIILSGLYTLYREYKIKHRAKLSERIQ